MSCSSSTAHEEEEQEQAELARVVSGLLFSPSADGPGWPSKSPVQLGSSDQGSLLRSCLAWFGLHMAWPSLARGSPLFCRVMA